MPFPPGTRLAVPLALAALVALGLACDRNVEPYVPGEEPSRPDLSRIFPPESESIGPEEGPARMPAPPPAPGEAPAAAAGPPVRGTISVAPDLADRVPEGGVLFVFARALGGGPPLAAKRIERPRLPLDFELGPADRMIASRPFRGPFRLTARIDADGNATTRSAGDLQGASLSPASPGDAGIAIVLDEVL